MDVAVFVSRENLCVLYFYIIVLSVEMLKREFDVLLF